MANDIKQVSFACNKSFCSANQRHKHMNPGDVLVMIAENVSVTIDFTRASPFVSGSRSILIPKGKAVAEFVGRNSGSFEYSLTCTNPRCATVNEPPEMIVD